MAATQMGWAFQFAPTGAFTLEANVIFETYALALAFAKTDPTALVGKVISVQTGDEKGVYMIEAIGTNGSLKKVGSDIDLSNYVTKDQLTSVYTYKGSVATYEELPTLVSDSTLKTGDVYNVEAAYGNHPAGTNWVWSGSAWDALAGSIDLSGYATKSEVSDLNTSLTGSIGSLTGELNTVKGDVAKKVDAVEGSSLISAEKLALIDTNAENISLLQESDISLDTRLKVIEGAFKGEGGTIDLGDIKPHLTDHGSRIVVLEGDNTTNKSNITTLQGEVSGHAGRLTAIENLNTEQSTQLSGLTTRVENVEKYGESITNLTTLVNGHTESISTLTTGINEAKALASSEAAQALVDAKAYADGLAGNYDAAGTAAGLNNAMDERVKVLEAIDHEKLATDAAASAVTTVLDGAPEKFDTLKEIATWIADSESATEAADLVTRVATLEAIDHDAYKAADVTTLQSAKDYTDEKIALLGTAAYKDVEFFATAAQGALAETAAQQANTYTKAEVDAMWDWINVQ